MNNFPTDFQRQEEHPTHVGQQTFSAYVSAIMRLVYLKMCGGLAVSALVAYFFQSFAYVMYEHMFIFWGLVIAELVLVFALTRAINKMSTGIGTLMFILFAVVNGLTMTSIFSTFSTGAIVQAFAITAATFGTMSVVGYLTRIDLSKMGSLLYMVLIGLLIAMVVNFFLASSTLDWIINFGGVVVFVGLTAWDTQSIKRSASVTPEANIGRLATMGALTLYLDFINMFLFLLRFLNSSRS